MRNAYDQKYPEERGVRRNSHLSWGALSLAGWLVFPALVHAQQRHAAPHADASCTALPANPLLGRITLSAAIAEGKENLCPAIEAWSRWHFNGIRRIAAGAAPASDSLFQLVDVAFAIYRSKLGPEAAVRADSMPRESHSGAGRLLYLTAVQYAHGPGERPDCQHQ